MIEKEMKEKIICHINKLFVQNLRQREAIDLVVVLEWLS